MTPQDTIRATTEAGQSWFQIYTADGGFGFIVFVVMGLAIGYLIWRLRDKDVQTEGSYKVLYDQQASLIARVEQAERNAIAREEECQRNLARTREEMEGQRLMIVRLRDKLFQHNVLTAADQRELDETNQRFVLG